jgi:hypothetical protein
MTMTALMSNKTDNLNDMGGSVDEMKTVLIY